VQILILHLSDIHFRSNVDRLSKQAAKIKEAIVGSCPMADACFIAISGDIANTGDPGEYVVAQTFFAELRATIAEAGISQVELIAIPGNHDCNFRVQSDTRKFILTNLAKYLDEPIDFNGSNFEAIIGVQTDFFEFEAALRGGNPIPISERIYFQREFTVGDHCIVFHCFNTSWLSRKNEIQSELYIPAALLTACTPPQSLLSFAMFHHPYNWLNAENHRALKAFVQTQADIILSGHEHEAGYSRRQEFTSETTYLEAPALNDPRSGKSGFQLVRIDVYSCEQTIHRFEWSGTYFHETGSRRIDFVRNSARPENPFKISDSFRKYLTAVGTGFRHPRCTPPNRDLTLRDIYVYPDLRHRRIDKIVTGAAPSSINIPGDRLVEFIEEQTKVLIHGADDSGKTSLVKILFEDFHDRGIVPLRIDGVDLRKCTSEAALIKTIRSAAEAQYSKAVVEQYCQLDVGRKLLIIDDFDSCGLSRTRQRDVIEKCAKLFAGIVVFASDLFRIQELAHSEDLGATFGSFQHCDIKETGNYHRQLLIEKWHHLGREDNLEADELGKEVIRSDKTISTLIGKNVLPHYPVTILTLLQLMEASEVPNTANGSYGYLYEVLIKTALAGVTSGSRDVDLQVTYLSGIAYAMFKSKQPYLTEQEFRAAHEKYCDRYDIVRDFSKMVSDCSTAEILVESAVGYHFKYRYIYFYFVAKYCQENSAMVRRELNEIADHIYNETNTNILIFYVYLTKDAELIRRITENSKRIYDECKPCDLEKDVTFLNTLYTQAPPPLHLMSTDVRSNREAYNRKQDEAAEQERERQAVVEEESYEYDRQLEDVIKINIAFKTLRILGQIIRNFPGSLDGQLKLEITEECYSVGMRTLTALLLIAERNLDSLRQYLGAMIAERTGLSDHQLADKTDKAIIWLTMAAAFGSIKRVSYAVGHQELIPTYEKVLSTHDTLATRVIDAVIKLDHDKAIPEASLKELRKRVIKNPFAYTVIRDLVADFLYFYKIDYSIMQQLGASWDIRVAAPKYLENRSKKN
jgi:hypothetical protein